MVENQGRTQRVSSNPQWQSIQVLFEQYQASQGEAQAKIRDKLYAEMYVALPELTRAIVRKRGASGGYGETQIAEEVEHRVLEKNNYQMTQLARKYDPEKASVYTWFSTVVRNEFQDWYYQHVQPKPSQKKDQQATEGNALASATRLGDKPPARRIERVELDDNYFDPLAHSAESQLNIRRNEEDLYAELARLPADLREVIQACILDEEPQKQFAERKGLSESKVSRLKDNAVDLLGKFIRQKRQPRHHSLGLAKQLARKAGK